jgi:hypothetical protein
MPGFPNRPDLATFGSDAVNTRAVRDPSRELSADYWNLLKYQVAGMGLLAWRAHVRFTANTNPTLLGRAEAWNPRGLTSAPFTNPVLTKLATGRYSVVYASPVTDEAGASVALSFAYGTGFLLTPSLTVLKTVVVTPLSGSANGVHVAVYNAAGALEDGNNVGILIG